ncbi:hypothetical protein E2C01_005487 [Portunus trituberculatus]|uniref:Uncharacterized protein n=1 Tax=Portunus trituberculatus TaxID=210409 RepID=A0A5B7CUI5_PORTR|nr:hypothetical protein [Portunus trituberculatus]
MPQHPRSSAKVPLLPNPTHSSATQPYSYAVHHIRDKPHLTHDLYTLSPRHPLTYHVSQGGDLDEKRSRGQYTSGNKHSAIKGGGELVAPFGLSPSCQHANTDKGGNYSWSTSSMLI